MLELIYPGRSLALDSPLGVEELTRRLQATFDGTFAGGRVHMMRRVRGRNSFRSLVDGRILPAASGSRLDLRLRLHPLVLAFGAIIALVAGTIAALAAPDIPVIGVPPLLVRLLAMAAVTLLFALLGAIEARLSTRLLVDVAETTSSQRRNPS